MAIATVERRRDGAVGVRGGVRVAVLSNDVVPGMGLPSGGQGMRALATAHAFAAAGARADVLIAEATVRERLERWTPHGLAGALGLPPSVRLFRPPDLAALLEEYDAAVLHNWAADRFVPDETPARVRFVYDIFSVTTVEHAFLDASESYAAQVLAAKRRATARASLFWGNGPGRIAHAREWLVREAIGGDVPTVLDVPFAPCFAGLERKVGTAGPVVVGGFAQAWAPAPASALVEAVARVLPDRETIVLGGGEGYHRTPQGGDDGDTPLRVARAVGPMAFEPYAALIAGAGAFVDVSPSNAERRVSFSSRAVAALALGCPVVHDAGTDLGALIARYGAGVAVPVGKGPLNTDVVAMAVSECVGEDRHDACAALMVELAGRAGEGVRRTLALIA